MSAWNYLHVTQPLTLLCGLLSCSSAVLLADDRGEKEKSVSTVYQGAGEPLTSLAAFGLGVRDSEWKSPNDEMAGFRLPPGFQIKLFASEPQIAKPLNMAWDWKGRLWITNTVEYPYPADEAETAGDSIRILEDTDGDGSADMIKTFAEGLNIPMGLIPVEDGVVCFSIPYLWHLRDVDGDDKVDERIRLLGPFDTTRDTHGMVNALRRGSDGWIYACHGFNNQSSVQAADSSSVELVSGNTFRFKADGSRIEQVTQGQVNPFGQTQDRYGNFFSADCHSKPLTALLESACYPSFGRPDDGLGFAPEMMEHLHGSTAISGLALYQDDAFPNAYRDKFYSGNVMTSRVNCNSLEWLGSTARASEQVDFLTSDDTWFRPVDLNVGPDGALYVADFYNKIIGHYEVPLEHPGRDRTSGRIWRIEYVGSEQKKAPRIHAQVEVPGVHYEGLLLQLQQLGDRLREGSLDSSFALTPDQLRWWADAFEAKQSAETVDELNRVLSEGSSQAVRLIAYAALVRVAGLKDESLKDLLDECHQSLVRSAVVNSEDANASVLLCHILRSTRGLTPQQRELVVAKARSLVSTPAVRAKYPQCGRAGVECLGQFGSLQDVNLLAEVFRAEVSDNDPALRHSTKIAIRGLLQQPGGLIAFTAAEGDAFPQDLAEVLPGIPTVDSMLTLLDALRENHSNMDKVTPLQLKAEAMLLTHLPKSDAGLVRILEYVEWASRGEPLEVGKRLAEVVSTLRGRGEVPSDRLLSKVNGLLQELIQEVNDAVADAPEGWELTLWREQNGRVWPFQSRNRQDGKPAQLRSSHALGESYTGVLRSETFDCPDGLSFWLAGHNGHPQDDDLKANAIRLLDAETGAVYQVAYPPRNDVARRIEWQTKSLRGRRVFVECEDACDLGAYAWIAFGDFAFEGGKAGEFNLIATVDGGLPAAADTLGTLFAAGAATPTPKLKSQVRNLLDKLPDGSVLRVLLLRDWLSGTGRSVRAAICDFAVELSRFGVTEKLTMEMNALEVAAALCAFATIDQQRTLANRLSKNRQGLELLAGLLTGGQLSAQAMQDISKEQVPSSIPRSSRSVLLNAIAEVAGQSEGLHVDLKAWESAFKVSSVGVQSLRLGEKLYEKHCQNCHQLRGKGLVVGPQLDGVVVRSQARLLQDILLPNANVDRAFRQSTLLLDNDEILRGIVVPGAGGAVRIIDSQGKDREVPKSRIVSRKDGGMSLMPANFHELLSPKELQALIAFIRESGDGSIETAEQIAPLP
jgi:putative heme-binding domain-containing protein